MKHIKRRYIWFYKESPRIRLFIPYTWLRAFALYGGLLCVLVLMGVGVYLLVPQLTLHAWWEGAVLAAEELVDGAQGPVADEGTSSPEASPSRAKASAPYATDSIGQENRAPMASLLAETQPESGSMSVDSQASGSPPPNASLLPPRYLRRDTLADRADKEGGVEKALAPLAGLLAARHEGDVPSPKPEPSQPRDTPRLTPPANQASPAPASAIQATAAAASTNQGDAAAAPVRRPPDRIAPVAPESGLGEITIVSLMPQAYVEVDDQIITEAPATLQVPWPARYEVKFHLGAEEVYAAHVQLTAENHMVSFSIDPDAMAP